MQSPVSVIIPCYRCADTIERAVESVIVQTLPPKEILLVEDCSDDKGVALASMSRLQQNFQGKASIRIIPLKKNSGPGGARNVGWDEAQQPYLAFLDADDSWHPRKLEIQYQWMESHPEVALTGHPSVLIESGKSIPVLPEQLKARPISGYSLLISNCFPTRSVMLRREIAYRFDPAKRYAEDYLLWLRIVLGGKSAWLLELPLAYSYKADFGAKGLTGNLWKMEIGELDTYRRVCKDGMIPRTVHLGLSLLSLLKYLRRLILVYFQRI
ncbi:MAG: glycosyltransferase [Gallionella sp.]|nr:glycosyltransferase [Gallionella sp.]